MLVRAGTHGFQQFSELYRYREVLGSFVGLQLKLKYRRTALGYVWSLLNPILQLTVLSVVFSHLVRGGVENYTAYLFAGLLPWTYFSNTLIFSSTCFIENEHYLKKVYLPKMIFPVSRMTLALVDFIWALTAFTIIGLFLKFYPSITWLVLPFAIFLLSLCCLGASLMVSVLNVYFRDVQYLIGVVLQMLYFLTPIIYPVSMIPGRLGEMISWNPIFWQIQLFHRILHEGVFPTANEWLLAAGAAVGFFLAGVLVLSLTDEEIVFRL